MKRIFIVSLFLFSIQNTFTQSLFKDDYKRISVDLYTGLASFHGDILNSNGFQVSTKLNWHLTSAFSVYGDFSVGNLSGNNKKINNSFNNNTIRTMFGIEAYLFNILRFNSISRQVQPFLGIAAGGIKSNVSKSIILDQQPEKLYKNWAFMYTFTGGFKIKLSNSFDANIKINLNFTRTDSIDNYRPIFIANLRNDAYNEYLVGITYHIGKKFKKPVLWNDIENPMFSPKRKPKKTDKVTKEEEKEKPVAPVYTDPNESESIDIDKNEYDCVPKY